MYRCCGHCRDGHDDGWPHGSDDHSDPCDYPGACEGQEVAA